jgi:hypothetical protein
LGGIEFGGQQQSIYWQAIERYLKGKVHSTFERWNVESKEYPDGLRRASLDGVERILGRFLAGIRQSALQTDQALRGAGTPRSDVSAFASTARPNAGAECWQLAESYRALLGHGNVGGGDHKPQEPTRSWRGRIGEALSFKPGIWGISVDLKKLFGRK